ncbi:YicC/YloC family endoribonuclease [uncultured Nevskia sp.]|uniref:YicC/YloC family endoribonuclease n=1 Tax=uncultured Nevskia sp. TaxID=228950 RepID=UPI002600DB25|nr:YicC/YloC family endoribonuclease [uncultured Nevskia sp.]
MTGYARAEQQNPSGRLSWELRSVNHRYLELQFKLPEEFRSMENDLRQLATQRIGRGKVEAGLRYSRDNGVAGGLQIDTDRLAAVLAAVEKISGQLRTSTAPDPIQVLAWPGVVRIDSAPDVTVPLADAMQLFQAALDDFTATRSREGERTKLYLVERLDAMAVLVERVKVRAPQVRDAWLDRLRAKIAELGVDVDPARLAQEAALAAQRLDVDEELSRLGSHFTEVRDTLVREEAVGRRLDFLMQELNREANTLSSKSQDAEMTRCAVEMKVIIEQMREQVQNIE